MRTPISLTILAVLSVPLWAEAGGACDLLDEDAADCAEGECCLYLDFSEGPVCAAVGVGVQDEECTRPADCACAHACIGFRGETTCARWCGIDEPDDDLCPSPALCITGLQGETGPLGFVCRTPDLCNPLTQDCEDPDHGCYVISPEGATDCADAGDGVQGVPCGFQNDCAEGYGCANEECRQFCNPDLEGEDCDAEPCRDRGSTVPGGSDPVGYCGSDADSDSDGDSDGDADADVDADADEGGCGCRAVGGPAAGPSRALVVSILGALFGALFGIRKRRS